MLERLRLEKQQYEETIRRRYEESEALRELQYAIELIEAMGPGILAFGSDTMRMALQMSTELLLNPDTYQSLMEAIGQLSTAWELMMHRLLQVKDGHRPSAATQNASTSW
jgi:hypothetical protein